MNWYKKAQLEQEFEDPEKFWFPEADHDYDPAWDYEMDEIPDETVVSIVDSYVEKLKKNLLPQISDIIKGMKIGYIKNSLKIAPIAVYASGTAPWPAILIDIEATKRGIEEYGGEIYDAIEMNIVHELGHAIQDSLRLPFNEQQAEDFAFSYQFHGEIDKFWE